jgi:hypothetical protein
MRDLIALALLCAASSSHAACSDELLVDSLRALHPGAELDREFSSCKAWPMHPDRLLMVLARRTPVADAPEDVFGLDVDLAVADAADGHALAHFPLPEAIDSDAWRLSDLALDTARYRLAPGVDAFGLRIEHVGSSSVNPGSDTQLHLFAWDGRQLRRVLNGWDIGATHGENNGGYCGYDDESEQSTLAVQPESTHGLADLRVTETGERSIGIEDAYACHETTTKLDLPSYTLTFDGKEYGLNPASRN